MNEVIQNLKADVTNGNKNFCMISESVLNAIKELSKKEYKENQQLKEQLQTTVNNCKQRDEVIDELSEFLKTFHNYENRFKWCEQDYIDTIEKMEEILQKYKGDNNEKI